jgi:murein DD-endopeptidase MepM/ murein hydrolase activator NlpD
MSKRTLLVGILLTALAVAAAYIYWSSRPSAARLLNFRTWINSPESHPEWTLAAGSRCGSAPFLFPTDGLVGFLWGDSFRPGHRHQGIDIFAGTEVGITPVTAAYPGYLTRQSDWKASVIVRVPDDPLRPGRQIWVYYTHMADPQGNSFISEQFPMGTFEEYVEAGTLLGYQGNFSGEPGNPVGVHLHLSIVEDDGFGGFKNELDFDNTYDPSPYLGLPLNAGENPETVPTCQ